MCTKDSYICSLHFVGGNGPTKDDPDLISGKEGKFIYLSFCNTVYRLNEYFIPCLGVATQS